MPIGQDCKKRIGQVLLGALCVAVASQINIGLLGNGFKVSAGILLLPLFSFFVPRFPVFLTAAAASPLVFLLRGVTYQLSAMSGIWPWREDAPEILFYLTYGVLLALYLRRVSLHPLRLVLLLPLPLFDFCANGVEIFVRMGMQTFSAEILLRLAAVALVRGAMIAGMLLALERYGFTVLRQEDRKRYRRLLLMTSMLRAELAWMRKSAAMIERTMNSAYSLYNSLRADWPGSAGAASALSIARDIHEVKKEYMLIVRGVTEALERENTEDGMYFREIWEILEMSLSRMAIDAGKQVQFSFECSRDFYTKRHYELLSIFRNLLNNAFEAAGEQPAQITLRQEEQPEEWCFTVQDTCGGIPEKLQDKIFLEGFSSKINYETGEINRGLGLSLVRDLTEEVLGGSIRFTSTADGTTFYLRFPKNSLEESV